MTGFEEARAHLKTLRICLRRNQDQYQLSYWNRIAIVVHTTEDLGEALLLGEHMADNPPEPPEGPLPRNASGARVRRHNKMRLEKRWKRQRKAMAAEIAARLKRN